MRADIVPGAAFPDNELSDHRGRKLQKDLGYWFFGRPTVEELRIDLRAVLKGCRPDWDISSSAQRTAWEKGDRAGFSPYGKTQAQTLADQD